MELSQKLLKAELRKCCHPGLKKKDCKETKTFKLSEDTIEDSYTLIISVFKMEFNYYALHQQGIYMYTVGMYMYIYPDTAKHQSKPQVYKSDIAPCGQI